jgi:crotonobetaine/carnitine-CoA ligase
VVIERTLGAFTAQMAEAMGDAQLVDCEGERLSYGQLHERSTRFATALHELGVRKGDRVAIMMSNRLEFLYAWFGIATLGAIEVPVHNAARGLGIQHVLATAGASVLIIEEAFAPFIAEHLAALPEIHHVVVLGAGPLLAKPVVDFADLLATPARQLDIDVRPEDPSVILFTGGTTGPPKGVVLTHNANLHVAISVRDLMQYTEDDVLFSVFPLFHVNAKYTSLLAAMVCRARLVIRQRFSASGFWDTCRKEGVTTFNFMGAMLTMLYKQPERPDDAQHPVRRCFGAPAPEAIFEPFERRFGVEIIDCYGMTEVGVAVWNIPGACRPGSCGKPVPWYEVELHDENDQPVTEPGAPGEICIRPRKPHIMIERYWGADEYTIAQFRNLWFHTGDRARSDEDGYIWFLDRTTDSIRRRGENVSSWEVEQAVSADPRAQEAAAYGVASELGEQEVMVAVVPKPGMAIEPGALIESLTDRLPRFAIPRYVRVISELPKTHAQRIQKYRLREEGITPDTWDRELVRPR